MIWRILRYNDSQQSSHNKVHKFDVCKQFLKKKWMVSPKAVIWVLCLMDRRGEGGEGLKMNFVNDKALQLLY